MCGACAGLSGSHFYPRPPRGGRLLIHAQFAAVKQISIHALREEGDYPYCPPITG